MKHQLFLAAWSLLLLFLSTAIYLADTEKAVVIQKAKGFEVLRGKFSRLSPNTLAFFLLASVICLSLFVRLVPVFAMSQGANYDIDSFRLVGESLDRGIDIYSNPATQNRHPYLPFQAYWIGFSTWIAAVSSLKFETVVRLEPILSDAAITFLIFKFIEKSFGKREAFRASALFAVNPISSMVSAYHGQFDSVPVLLLLLGAWFAQSGPNRAGIFVGLGILAKSWPVLAVPSIITNIKSRKLNFSFWIGAIPILGTVLYSIAFKADLVNIIRTAISYNNGIGVWGYTYILRLISLTTPLLIRPADFFFQGSRFLTLILLGLTWYFLCRKVKLIPSILILLIAFLVFTHAFSIQYLSWLVPFAILDRDYKWVNRYTLASFSYMFLVYNTLIMTTSINNILPMPAADLAIIIPFSLPVWFVLIGWLNQRYKAVYASPLRQGSNA